MLFTSLPQIYFCYAAFASVMLYVYTIATFVLRQYLFLYFFFLCDMLYLYHSIMKATLQEVVMTAGENIRRIKQGRSLA